MEKKRISVGLFYGIGNAEKVGKYEFDKSYVQYYAYNVLLHKKCHFAQLILKSSLFGCLLFKGP